jgi:hypothetical protein
MSEEKEKIAVALYGFLRHFEEARKFSNSFFDNDKYDIEIFLFCPKHRNDPQAISANTKDIVTQEMLRTTYGSSLKKASLWDYNISEFVERAEEKDLPLFNKRLIPCERYFSLFYHMQNAMQMVLSEINSGTKYKHIFISRPDISLRNFIGFDSEILTSNDHVITLPKRPVVYHNTRFDDRFFAVNPSEFHKIVNVYDNLDEYVKNQKLLFIPEDIMCHHIRSNGVKTSSQMLVSLHNLLFHNHRSKHRYEHVTGRKMSTLRQTNQQQAELIRKAFEDYDESEMNLDEQQSIMKRLLMELQLSTKF